MFGGERFAGFVSLSNKLCVYKHMFAESLQADTHSSFYGVSYTVSVLLVVLARCIQGVCINDESIQEHIFIPTEPF